MAFPKDINSIDTNLSQLELQDVVEALKKISKPDIQWLGQPFLLAGMCQAKFMFRGKIYTLTEEFETVISIRSIKSKGSKRSKGA